MQLFADTCNIPVILPHSHSAAVVSGSAMLGRFAAEVLEHNNGAILETQADVERASDVHKDRLWNIMVSFVRPSSVTADLC
jgi:ribulose kinase